MQTCKGQATPPKTCEQITVCWCTKITAGSHFDKYFLTGKLQKEIKWGQMKHARYANEDNQWWLKHGKFIDTQMWKSGLFFWCSSWNAFSFLLYRRVVPRRLEYFNFLDDPLSNNVVVCRNHPSRHQIERSPWIVKQNLYWETFRRNTNPPFSLSIPS